MKLGELCILFTDGDWIESKDQSDSGIRLIQTGNIGNGEFLYKNDKAKYISVDTFKRLNCKEVFPNDILVSRLPEPVGRGCIIPAIGEKMITAVDCTICRINENLVDRKYFCYFLESNAYKTQLEQHVTGTTRKRISRKNLSNVEIDIPEQAKQKEVVYKLDRLKKTIQNYNRELDLLDELVRARFVEMFGRPTDKITRYPKVKIGNLIKEGKASIKAGPFGSSLKKEFYVKKGFKIYGQEQVIKNDPTFGDYYINEDRFNSLKSCEVHAGDILISLVGTCGKTMIMPENFEPGIINPRLLKIAFDAEFIIPIYFKYFFGSDDLQKILNSASGHSTMNVVNAGMLKNVELIMAPIELQNQFASFVEEIDKSRPRIQKSLETSQELFDSLMQEYFG